MKKIYTLIIALLPLFAVAQFTYVHTDADTKVEHLGSDIEFNLAVTNLDASNPMDIRWRISTNNFVSTEWKDYVCDEICYTPNKRFNDIALNADTTFPIIHHISMNEVHGMGSSTLCFFDKDDSANTVQCLTLTAYSTPMLLTDTLLVSGTDYEVILGEVYTVSVTTYTLYTDAYVLDAGTIQFLVIDGEIYVFEGGEFVPYEDEIETVILGTTYHIINGFAFTKAGNQYTLVGAYKETTIAGAAAIIIDGDTFVMHSGSYAPLGLEEFAISTSFLNQNTPNPFVRNTVIEYAFTGAEGTINIHDLTGKLVRQINLTNKAGKLTVGDDLQAGLYFYSLYSDGMMIDTKRMQVMD